MLQCSERQIEDSAMAAGQMALLPAGERFAADVKRPGELGSAQAQRATTSTQLCARQATSIVALYAARSLHQNDSGHESDSLQRWRPKTCVSRRVT